MEPFEVTSSPDPQPCPWCGHGPMVSPSGDGAGVMIDCVNPHCGVQPHVSYYGSGVAVAKWNDRRAPAAAMEAGTCWLVERTEKSEVRGPYTLWLCATRRLPRSGPGYVAERFDWTDDANKAIRFARREDAEIVSKVQDTGWNAGATEHAWFPLRDAAHPPGAGLAALIKEAEDRWEGWLEEARQCSAEEDKAGDRQCMAASHQWLAFANKLRTLSRPASGEGGKT